MAIWLKRVFILFFSGAVILFTRIQLELPGSYISPATPESMKILTPHTATAGKPVLHARTGKTEPQEPGILRGDWGMTLTYRQNDRVNYQGGEYLSLWDSNRNHPPDSAPDFWILTREPRFHPEENCKHPGPGAQLGGCDFSDALDLKDQDLSGADLSGTRLSGDFGAANLAGANLNGAALTGALILGPNTRLDHAHFSELQSDGNMPLIAEHADLTDADFSRATLYGANLRDATLQNANLSGATLTGADLTGSRLGNADLRNSDLSFATLQAGQFAGAMLDAADLTQADLSEGHFAGAKLNAANLSGARIDGADFSGADLRGANLADVKGADSAWVDLQTNFTEAICPDGTRVDGILSTTCMGHGF